MVNDDILRLTAQQVPAGSVIVEIGAGLGQLTKKLAPLAQRVLAIEIDDRFKNQLDDIQKSFSNVEIVIGNALKIDFNLYSQAWVVGNIPFHITEPLINKMAKSNLKGMVFLVGKSFAEEAMAVSQDMDKFGKLSMLVAAFFKPTLIATVGKENFEPKPRTESAILKLIPLQPIDYQRDKKLFLMRQLFLTAGKSPLVKNALRESLIRFGTLPMTKNEAKNIVMTYEIPETILIKPFEQLNNKEYRILYEALKKNR
jgi:16S rRNA (adenine1518-N6/adenine1519-N6)-dimethyltransferase